jgi:Tfp pilus assembly protein PilX
MNAPAPHRQRGITLITALIMLVLLTLVALASFNLGKSNLQIVTNMQERADATAAADEVIEEAISNTRFAESPGDVLAKPCGAPNTRCVDTNGDGKTDVKVTLNPTPKCVMAPMIRNDQLTMERDEDLKCMMGGNPTNGGVEGANNNNSACADAIWEVAVTAKDVQTDAQVGVVQGVGVRIDKDTVVNNCPTP